MMSTLQLLALVATSGTLVACNASPAPGPANISSPTPGPTNTQAETPASMTFDVAASGTFQVVLPSGAAGGYGWHLLDGYDTRVVTLLEQRVGPLPSPPLAGQSADEIFDFKALMPGATTLHFSQYRVWEGPEHAVATRAYPVTVH